MTFITLAMMAFLCLFIPVALPVSAISAVILLYFYPQQTLALLVVITVAGISTSNIGENDMLNDYIPEAIEMVSTWNLPDEAFAEAVNAQARLMAGICPDESWLETH